MGDLFDALGRLALTFQAAPPGVPGRIWDQLGPWFARLVVNAAPKWLPRLSFAFPCSVPVFSGGKFQHACPKPAVAACDVCGKPCCLDHSRIDQLGDAICYACVIEAVQRRVQAQGGAPAPKPPEDARPPERPPPTPAEVTWARKQLGVKRTTPWEEVRARHRKLLGKWHPDRHRSAGPAAEAAADAKFKEIDRAFGILSRSRDQKEAA